MSREDRTPSETLVQCECGYTRQSTDPLPCPRCTPKEHRAAFVELTRAAIYPVILGHDHYSDGVFFFHAETKLVFKLDGLWLRHFKYLNPDGKHDALIADLTAVREENVALLAENARLRRRLEGK